MIIYASKPGQLGNMLIIAASLEAKSIVSGTRIYNPAFHPYNKYFIATEKKTSSSLPYHFAYFFARLLDKLDLCNGFLCCRHLDWDERLELDSESRNFPLVYFIQGWQVRCNRYLKSHAALIRQRFSLSDKYAGRLNQFWSAVDTRKIHVGIHIRRGDYREFEGGRYFYQLSQYREVMINIQYLLGTEQVVFLVSSNEPVPTEEIAAPGIQIIHAPGHEVVDMYALARCNYLAGPPSTFTMWASFYGEVPLYMIRDPEHNPALHDFLMQSEF